MSDYFRWQWMWRSRGRLIAVALGMMLLGAAIVTVYLLIRLPIYRIGGMILVAGGSLVISGGYQLLQAVFSPAEAFGQQDDD